MKFDQSELMDWDLPNGLVENKKINGQKGSRIFCHDEYAQELADLFASDGKMNSLESSKDLLTGGVYTCEIISLKLNEALAQTESGQTIYIDLDKERKDANRLGISVIDFTPGAKIKAKVRKMGNSYSGSVVEYHIQSLRIELFEQIKKETSAYTVKIESINKGGYIVDLSGVKCFLPGSLAAANKITDFESYIGKTLPVMIEGYIEAKDIFIVSYKKYLGRIMETKIQELDLTKKYKGSVTGTSDFGVFVEWDDVYTGLIHKTEFTSDNSLGGLHSGDEIEFYVKEIKDNNRLTLTLDKPMERNVILADLESQIKDGTLEPMKATVKHKRKNGILIELNDINLMALVPQYKIGRAGDSLKAGDTVSVILYEVETQTGKIFGEIV